MDRIAVAELTSEAFAPFGEVGALLAGGIMRRDQRGLVSLAFAA
jgi:ureidoglycolate hydrolase